MRSSMLRLRHGSGVRRALAPLLLLALVAGACGSVDVVSAHTAHGRDLQGAGSQTLSCVPVVPTAAGEGPAVASEAAVPAGALAPVLHSRAVAEAARRLPAAAPDPPRFLLHAALLI